MDAIQTLENLMRRHREEGRAVDYADLVPVLAALKAQRDELLSDMQWAVGQLEQLDEANAQMVAVTLRAALAKHKEASHG